MKFKEIAFVAYAVTDVKRARRFYEEVLGLTPKSVFEKGDFAFIEYWLGPKDEYALAIGAGASFFKPGKTGGTAALEVDGDYDAAIAELKKKGAKLVLEKNETPVCWMTIVEDPDGNQLVIHQRKPGRT